MPKYRPDRWIFASGAASPKARHEQLMAWEIVRTVATGERPNPEYVGLHTPSKHVFGGGQWEGANLTALGTVASALAGITPPERVTEMYRSERLNGPGHFEGKSVGYGNYQVDAAVGGLELGGEAAEESARKLRRDLAWWILWSTPDGKVIAPQGRAYSAAHPEHAQEIVRALMGLPPVRPPEHQWWAWTGAYSAQLFLVEYRRLNHALFTAEEWGAIHNWRVHRDTDPELRALLSELRAPEGARWELRAWADGSHAGVVSGLRPYIDGPNGMIPAVVSEVGNEPAVVWTDHHGDGEFVGNGAVRVAGSTANKILGNQSTESPQAVIILDHEGLTINGERVAPVRDLPALAPWEPSRVGVEGDPVGDKPGPKPEPEQPDEPEEEEEPMPEDESKVPPPQVAKDPDLRRVQETLEVTSKTDSSKAARRWAHRALVKLNKLGAWEWEGK